jgi:hypothetical protein
MRLHFRNWLQWPVTCAFEGEDAMTGNAPAPGRPIHYKSLREHIAYLRTIGEVHEIDQEVDWNLEIGAIMRRICEIGGPAVLFNRIKGIERGFRVFGAPAAASARPG